MTEADWMAILDARLEKTRSVLAAKAGEYARVDHLHNFKRAAALRGCTPAEALVGMLVKHLVSVLDLVDDAAAGNPDPVRRLLDEKIGDAVNYLILLEAVLRESVGPAPAGHGGGTARGGTDGP